MPLDPTASITIAGVTCWDVGTEEEFCRAGQRSQATRSLLCAWEDRVPLINAILSPAATTGAASITGIGYFNQPYAYPAAPWLLLEQVKVKGITGSTGLGEDSFTALDGSTVNLVAPTYAAIQFVYRSQDYQAFDNGTLTLDFGLESLPVPRSAPFLSFEANDTNPASTNALQPEDSPTLTEPIVRIVRTRRNLTSAQMDTLLGTILAASNAPVNSATFTIATSSESTTPQEAAIGTVRFDGATTAYRTVGGGYPMWDASLRFSYRSIGWNVAWNPGTNSFAPVYLLNSANGPYSTSDLNALLD